MRDWDDELASPLRDVAHLGNDFVLQVPRQNEKIIWLGFVDGLDRIDRDVHTRRKAAVLVRVSVHGKVKKICANAAVVEQRIAFAGSTIATDPRSLILCIESGTRGVDAWFDELVQKSPNKLRSSQNRSHAREQVAH